MCVAPDTLIEDQTDQSEVVRGLKRSEQVSEPGEKIIESNTKPKDSFLRMELTGNAIQVFILLNRLVTHCMMFLNKYYHFYIILLCSFYM